MARCNKCEKSGLFLKVNSQGLCSECAAKEIDRLNSLLTPELMDAKAAIEKRDEVQREISDMQKLLDSYTNDLQGFIYFKVFQIIIKFKQKTL